MEIYIVCYLGVGIYYCTIALKIKNIKNECDKNADIEKEEFFENIQKMKLACKFEKKDYYAYNPQEKKIFFIEKNKYGVYDLFGIYHEIGHYLDDLNCNQLYKNMKLTAINRIILMPLYFLFVFLNIIGYKIFSYLRLIIFILNCIFLFIGYIFYVNMRFLQVTMRLNN